MSATLMNRRSLAPREHGAYAQLAVPLAAAYAGGRPGVAALLFGVAAVMAFLAHEPLLILLGLRGRRVLAEAGPRARRRTLGLIVVGAVAGAAAAWLAPAAAPMVMVSAVLASLLGGFLWRRRERTFAGEVVAAAALASAALPVAVSAGWEGRAALAAFAGWSAGFAAVTFVVWSIAHKRTPGPLARTVALLVPALVVVAASCLLGRQAAATGAPLVLVAAAVTGLRPTARRLRPVGWTVAAATLAQAVVVVVLTR